MGPYHEAAPVGYILDPVGNDEARALEILDNIGIVVNVSETVELPILLKLCTNALNGPPDSRTESCGAGDDNFFTHECLPSPLRVVAQYIEEDFPVLLGFRVGQ